MTFDTFIKNSLGKSRDFDGSYGSQCTDLFRYYVKEVLHLPQPKSVTGAKDFWLKTDPIIEIHFTKIPNTLKNIPQKGDAIIWDKWRGNRFGHVAIFIEGDVNKFISLDQNFPTLSKVTKTRHNYLRPKVLGWLRAKGTNMDCKDKVIDYDDFEGKRHTNEFYEREWGVEKRDNAELVKEIEKLHKEGDILRKRNAELASTVSERDKQITTLTNETNRLKNDLGAANDEIERLNVEIIRLRKELETCGGKLCDYPLWERFKSLFTCRG